MSLLLNSSLVAGTESVIPSDFSGFLPFLKGGPEGGVVDDIALWPPNQDRHRAPGVGRRRRESVAAPPPFEHHHHHVVVEPTSLLEVAERKTLERDGKTNREKKKRRKKCECVKNWVTRD